MTLLRAEVRQTLGGEDVSNVLGFNLTTPGTAELQIATDIIADAWQTNLAPILSSAWTFVEVAWYDQDAPLNAPGEIIVPTGGQFSGVDGSNDMPPQIALLVKYVTTDGPPYRGSTYLTGFTEAANNEDGDVDNTISLLAIAWAEEIRVNIQTIAGTNRFSVVRPRTAAGDPAIAARITAVATDQKWATQRRRDGR